LATKVGFAVDSPLEQAGFEPSVPLAGMRSIVRSERRDRVAGIRGSLSLVKLETPAVDGAPTSPTGSRANVKERSPAAAGFCFRGPRPGIVLRGRPTLEESRITTRIAAAALPLLLSAVAPVAAEAMSTRFGTLSINNQYLLLFNGRPLSPEVRGNSALNFVRKFAIGPTDVVLLEDVGGTACPELFFIVSVAAEGARPTPSSAAAVNSSGSLKTATPFW